MKPSISHGVRDDVGTYCQACGPAIKAKGVPLDPGELYACVGCQGAYVHPFPPPETPLPEKHPLRLLVRLWRATGREAPKGMSDLGLAQIRGAFHTRDELLFLAGAALEILPTPERDELVDALRATLSRVSLKRLKVLRQRFHVVEHATYVDAPNDTHARELARDLPEDAWKWHKEYNRPTEYLVDEFGLTDEEDEDG